MKTKLFQVRLTKDHAEKDQETMNNFMNTITVKKTATQLVDGPSGFWSVLVFYELRNSAEGDFVVKASGTSGSKVFYPADAGLDAEEQKAFAALRQWRYEKAEELGLPAFMICSNAELVTVTKVKPKLFDDLQNIKGFGPQKIAKFGDDILAAVHSV